MREIRPSGSEGGVAPTRHPYPYPHSCFGVRVKSEIKIRIKRGERATGCGAGQSLTRPGLSRLLEA